MKIRIGKLLTTVGAAVGAFAAIAMAIKLKVTITPEMREMLFYRELFVASAVLLVLGAIIGRRENVARNEEAAQKELGGPSEPPVNEVRRDAERETR